jgi:hypothetical protein
MEPNTSAMPIMLKLPIRDNRVTGFSAAISGQKADIEACEAQVERVESGKRQNVLLKHLRPRRVRSGGERERPDEVLISQSRR